MVKAALVRVAGLAASVVIVLWGAATVTFLAFRVIPGDPVSVMLGPQAQVSEAVKDGIRADLGLDRPPFEQYLGFIGQLARGDLGESYQLRMPVADVIGRQLGATLQLSVLALLIALVLALAVAVFVRGQVGRAVAAGIELVVLSSPVFWIGLVLLSVFAFGLGWFPVSGARNPATLVLPAITLALPVAALLSQVLRDGLVQAERMPFAETVRARGASPTRFTLRHGLRHGAASAITLAAYLTGSVLGGAVLVETVFARPGLGRVTLAAISDRDLPVITGIILLSALVFVAVNLVVELVHPLIDPRVRGVRSGGVR
ncbi:MULTISPECIES: ABC transporter permease [unclassified Microbacterium]|uniref:ABC transporter permease n=1 Tax=unclassified Microbacterium TaxID=2609290 RepID=UPI000CFAE381|nr:MULTISPECIES: ABC transporter permease [unclassified Microbacterium]PQZ60546.1 ABC transporter permease [Microbacterium sp. MYb43]PQZ81972.1 ABC transporter permease [Microbacterium sp. MYb40]PRB22235.1 ABC transporter permease [Microbacterium sp. MYb54]PRB31200.1 ABC transporter permease [Microbacterium sp. MYb50]PRB69809.1 ABC transporter permease [Microbacterium sp. MYb24]